MILISGAYVQRRDTILVLCHSFFHDAFSLEKPLTLATYKNWLSSRFVANFIIDIQAELPEGSIFAVTAKQVFDSFALKYSGTKASANQKKAIELLRNSIAIIDRPTVCSLSIDESVFVICDTLYSRANYEPILVSSIQKKTNKAEEFYHKKNPNATIPFSIYTPIGTEAFLRGRFPELCKQVDERTKLGGQTT